MLVVRLDDDPSRVDSQELTACIVCHMLVSDLCVR